MNETDELLADVARRASLYIAATAGRRVSPQASDVARLATLSTPLPEHPTSALDVIRILDEVGSPATVASSGGRYFGFVTGGALPATLAANWLATAWDQNGALSVMSPIAAALEEVALVWLRDIFGFHESFGAGLTTGATMSNLSCLAAARTALLQRAGWNVEEQGLFGAPQLNVVVSADAHVSIYKALALLGFGRSRVSIVPTDDQGRIRSEKLPNLDERTIMCIQAGNVNTGAFDPAAEICRAASTAGAWVHVDGAFGLWAAAAPHRAHLLNGFSEADSWATDCHKWLNVPYDAGLAFVRDPQYLRRALNFGAPYLQTTQVREPSSFTPEFSRRARGVEVWAALQSLGRSGLAAMIERNCTLAARFADGLTSAGHRVLNDITLNQVLVSFGDSTETQRVIAEVQADGTCWCGGTQWRGESAMRISVSSWATTSDDVDRSLAAILRIATKPISPRSTP